MTSYRFAALTYATFQPIDLEKITGMKPALIRDWRRRDLIHESLDRSDVGFSAATAAELLLLARLSDHGIGPKRVYGWTRAFSGIILYHALDDATAWQSQEAWEAWKDDQGSGKTPDRYLAVYPAPHGLRSMDSLQNVMSTGSEIVTIVNMKALGEHLRTSAGQPLADVTWSYGMETE